MQDKNHMRHLRALIAVVEEGSIARAAQRLLRTPSAVASSIRQLETSFDATLFERQSAGMAPTPFGQAAYRRACRIEAELQLAAAELAPYRVSVNAPLFAMLVGERQLTALVRLREMGHMPSVAAVMGLTQPAVSALLRQAEASLKLRLFRRAAKGMAVTEAGELLLFRVRRVLAELRHLEADIAQQRGEMAGRVMFAALPSMRTRVLPQAIAALVGKHPNVQISMVDAPFEILFAGVHSGEIDFILTGLNANYSHRDFLIRVIGRDRLVVVARAGHPLCARERVEIADLVRYPWVLRDRGAPTRELLNDLFWQLGIEAPHVAVQAGDLGLLRGLLQHSDVVSAVSPEYLSYEIASGAVKVLDVELPHTGREIGFILRRDAQPSLLCEKLMQHIEAATAGTLAPAAPSPTGARTAVTPG
ncbi:hypothetical protein CDO46_09815 [Pigmentiphaga sp. NML030171]|uniref:LysR family transcriptional regulator n=1 Tax=Pigmentiphaga sp. NML030171 TaxID=2008676 RepID=UPI000B41B365|nr:LysR family transcriptional regulator [Pigmentiphaga sp. NML030171]OVZ63927.1 hypothetical protein CDO46_09815 [Pigmentiphaga sp. NML030171]